LKLAQRLPKYITRSNKADTKSAAYAWSAIKSQTEAKKKQGKIAFTTSFHHPSLLYQVLPC
jgi:hypothetical protein